jgi:minimal CRISPR polymerase domain
MKVYVYLDGDSVGDRLEGMLIDDDLHRAGELSQRLNEVVQHIAARLAAEGAEIIFAGGDNIFLRMELNHDVLHRSLSTFQTHTGVTASAGAGPTPADAFLALHSAKARGGGHLVVRHGDEPAESQFEFPRDRPYPPQIS